MAPTETTIAAELETAQRLRSLLGHLSRLLRPTETGTAKDLTPTRVAVLVTADRHGPLRLSELGEREGLNPTLLSRTVAHLVDTGLIERIADPDDRRSAWIRSTEVGHSTAEGVRHDRMVAVSAALDHLEHSDREAITAALPALERFAAVLKEARA